MSVAKKMASGMLWGLLEKVGQQILSFAAFLIVVRMIGPEEYGLVGLCVVFTGFATMIFAGIADAIISQQITEGSRLSTLFWAVILVGLILSLITFLSAEFFAGLFKDDRLVPLVRLISVLPFLFALSTVPTVLVNARLDFKLIAVRSIIGTLAGGICGVILALNGFGAYALVWQQIAIWVCINLIIWPAAGWVPRMTFNRLELFGVLAPGGKMTVSMIITFVENQVPRLIIGFSLGAVSVGLFSFAWRIFWSMKEGLFLPVISVMFPAFAKIKNDPAESIRLINRIVSITGFIALPAFAGGAMTSPQFVPLFFGIKWIAAVGVLQFFIFAMIPGTFLLIIREVLRAHGKIGVFVRFQAIIVALSIATMLLLVNRGLQSMVFGVLVIAFITFPFAVWVSARASGFSFGRSFGRLWVPVTATAAMVLSIYAIQVTVLPFFPPFVDLALLVLAGASVYLAVYALLDFRQLADFVKAGGRIRTLFKGKSQTFK